MYSLIIFNYFELFFTYILCTFFVSPKKNRKMSSHFTVVIHFVIRNEVIIIFDPSERIPVSSVFSACKIQSVYATKYNKKRWTMKKQKWSTAFISKFIKRLLSVIKDKLQIKDQNFKSLLIFYTTLMLKDTKWRHWVM